MSNYPNLKRPRYCLNFERHVLAFINEHKLSRRDKKIIVSVSGGVDSLALAEVLFQLKYPIELLHFNHGTRPKENLLEEKLVSHFANSRNIVLHTVHLKMSLDEKNFESIARNLRKKTYKSFIEKNYWVYTAHHIDDSFEWSLMQSFKQGSPEHSLGIPMFNNGIVRPFMCATKKHIKNYALASKISWIEDSSNTNVKFERNFLRLNITSVILKKYPKALAHYVAQSNELLKLINIKKKLSDLEIKKGKWGVLLVSTNLCDYKEEIKNEIAQLSSKGRGILQNEVEKLLISYELMKSHPEKFPFKGPLNFSGGVSAFLIRDYLLLTNSEQREYLKLFDQRLRSHLETMTQIPAIVFVDQFPYLLISFRKPLIKSSKFIHPLLPVTCLWLKNHSIPYVFTPLLPIINKQKLAFDAVILDSSILGL